MVNELYRACLEILRNAKDSASAKVADPHMSFTVFYDIVDNDKESLPIDDMVKVVLSPIGVGLAQDWGVLRMWNKYLKDQFWKEIKAEYRSRSHTLIDDLLQMQGACGTIANKVSECMCIKSYAKAAGQGKVEGAKTKAKALLASTGLGATLPAALEDLMKS